MDDQAFDMPSLIFRKGLDLGEAVAGELATAYHSTLVDQVRAAGYRHVAGRLTIHLARELGFCYGVDRAVDYAYQARRRFPNHRVFLTGEIIHNPHVNDQLRAADVRFLSDPGESLDQCGANDVVILPAFGVTVAEMRRLKELGCTLVDTTCGSVLNVWRNVEQYAADGFTAIIHGKVHHEETRATASQALKYPSGRYLVVLDREEAQAVCEYIRDGRDEARLLDQFSDAASPGFDFARDLQRVGCANQTTMLMSESLQIAGMFRQAMIDRHGQANLAAHFRTFDTICSATQERQDAVRALLDQTPLDLMIVVGGYNSSNTGNLARICAERVRTFHIADHHSLVSTSDIRHRPIGHPTASGEHEITTHEWLPPSGPVAIGLTAGASTPNIIVGRVIEALVASAGT